MDRRHRVLFVCSANVQRSPTAERIFQDWRDRWDAKSAGTMPYHDRRPLTQELVDWADIVIVMEKHHAHDILSNFQIDREKIKVLNIPDIYFRDDPELIQQLRMKVVPVLQSFD